MRLDIILSAVIGEIAALLMVAVSRNLALPSGIQSAVSLLPFVFPFFTIGVMIVGIWFRTRLDVAYQFSKFLLVGGSNFLVDLAVLNLFIALTVITQGFYAAVFKAVSFLVAMSWSFVWNKFWTFRSASIHRAPIQFAEFFAVSVVGILINVGTFAFTNSVVGPQAGIDQRTWASVSAAAAAVAGLLWNFLGYKFLVFRRESRS